MALITNVTPLGGKETVVTILSGGVVGPKGEVGPKGDVGDVNPEMFIIQQATEQASLDAQGYAQSSLEASITSQSAATTATTQAGLAMSAKTSAETARDDAAEDSAATAADRVQTGLDVATTLDYKDAAEVAAAAALTNSQVAGEHRVAASGFADSAEQSAIQAQISADSILGAVEQTAADIIISATNAESAALSAQQAKYYTNLVLMGF